jgi:hypothetical protein
VLICDVALRSRGFTRTRSTLFSQASVCVHLWCVCVCVCFNHQSKEMSKVKKEGPVRFAKPYRQRIQGSTRRYCRNDSMQAVTKAVVIPNVAGLLGGLAVARFHSRVKVWSKGKKILVVGGAVVASNILAVPYVSKNVVNCQGNS